MSNYQNVYQAPQKMPGASQSTTSGMAIASLVLGLASFICTVFTGLVAIILGVIALSKISSSNGRIGGSGMAVAGIITGALGCLWTLVMILPAVQQVRSAARRTVTMNNVRMLCLANLNYESANQTFPSNLSATNPEAGENLSWRVHILPFLDRQDLYNQFKLDEPWDSPNNKALIPQMPEYFQHPQLQPDLPEGYTVFHMPTSPAGSETPAMLVQGEQGITFGELSDGSSNTILILEVSASEAVPWTKPQDWQFDPDDPGRGLGDAFPGVFVAGRCDGSTYSVDREIDSESLNALLTRSAGDAPPFQY